MGRTYHRSFLSLLDTAYIIAAAVSIYKDLVFWYEFRLVAHLFLGMKVTTDSK